jgi:hypothetical protein
MSLKTPKTGLAARMREWMSGTTGTFTTLDVLDALDFVSAKNRDRVVTALRDFYRRGEVLLVRYKEKHNRRQPAALYRYNAEWKSRRGAVIMPKIHKAIYVAGIFSGSDIVRLSEAPDRSFVDEIIRKLHQEGLIVKVGRRKCTSGTTAENLYNIPNRDRYRVEVMK